MVVANPLAPYENIELLATVEMRPHNMLQGYIRPLYEIARGEHPVTYEISQSFLHRDKARFAIVTGIYSEAHFPKGEVDGPIGAAVLGRALSLLGHEVHLMVESQLDDVMRSLLANLGYSAKIVHTDGRSAEEVRGWADDYDFAVTIEKLGRAPDGFRHSVMGTPLGKNGDWYIDEFIIAMNENAKMTVGIGDGGNEIGFGKIFEEARNIVLFGERTVTTTATTYLFSAAVSNFGAYAVATALALGATRPELMVDGQTVKKCIEDVVALGCLDGGTVNPNFIGDDGIPIETVMRYVDQLGSIVSQWNGSFDRHF